MRNLAFSVAAILIVGGMLAAMQHTSAQAPTRSPERPIWSYKVVDGNDFVREVGLSRDALARAIEKGLNEAGEQGWELCQELNGAVVFKRQQ